MQYIFKDVNDYTVAAGLPHAVDALLISSVTATNYSKSGFQSESAVSQSWAEPGRSGR